MRTLAMLVCVTLGCSSSSPSTPGDAPPGADARLDAAIDGAPDAAPDAPPDAPPTPPPPDPLVRVSTNGVTASAVATDGSLWSWGDNDMGALGIGSAMPFESAAPVRVGTETSWASVAVGPNSCATRTDGTLWCWGPEYAALAPVQFTAATTWTNIYAVAGLTCGLHASGEAQCWGEGYLGDGATMFSDTPVTVQGGPWQSIAPGFSHACGIQTDGSLWCWGAGPIGHGTATGTSAAPIQIGAEHDWVSVSANSLAATETAACGVRANGTLWCWGQSTHGILGGPAVASALTPTQVGTGTMWQRVHLGQTHACATRSDGTLWCWGQLPFVGDTATLSRIVAPTAVDANTDWTAVAAGTGGSCGVHADGSIACWGSNVAGALGIGVAADQASPSQIGLGATWAGVATGYYHACATRTDGTAWCWGDNRYGANGAGAAVDAVQVPVAIAGLGGWGTLASGAGHACAIRPDQTLWCWGLNASGQLGDGTQANRTEPLAIAAGSTWLQVSGGTSHTCAIDTARALWCWGADDLDQLGDDGAELVQPTPLRISTGPWASVAASTEHSCGTKTDGTLWCWGSNNGAALAVQLPPAVIVAPVPTRVGTDTNWASVVGADDEHTCALRTDASLWCWGTGPSGEVGNGTSNATQTSTPALVLSGVARGAVGRFGACAVRTDGTLWCWGNPTRTLVPSQIDGATDWAAVGIGSDFVIATKTDGSLWSWGVANTGELGDGNAWRASPQRVLLP